MTPERWQALMRQWGAPDNGADFERLHAAYSEPHRHYHAVSHIEDCLAQLDSVVELIESPAAVETAVWFHDAIYQPRSSTNERDSADWAAQVLTRSGVSGEPVATVRAHIMATLHTGEALAGDTAFVVDIDVSILGREPAEYDVYEQAIRQEYRWVPGFLYRRKRIEILSSFLERPTLYATAHFRERYEQQARDNLARAVSMLRR